jgi:chemosensory pili system protein ChpB (putative protein-glutamate methylesterase)
MNSLKIGIVSETLAQLHSLKTEVEKSGYQSPKCLLITDVMAKKENSQSRTLDIDAWVVVVDVERLGTGAVEQAFQQWLYGIDKPVIFSEGNTHNAAEADYSSWTRQLKVKLLNLEGQIQLSKKDKIKAKNVWVIAASTGGPEAVKRFLDSMDNELDLGFLYVQHIDQTQCQVLCEKIARDSHYHSFVASHGDVVCRNSVAVVPSENVIELQENGSIVLYQDRQWRGMYKPSIDHVVANVARGYGTCAGVIFFTGMGDDGVVGCRLMSLQGGQIWAQSIASCVAPSMPQAAINTGHVKMIDTPESLAAHLKILIQNTTQ